MPIVHFHLPAGAFTVDQLQGLLVEGSAAYARILDSPIERVRAFIVHYEPNLVAVGGRVADSAAPYFTAIVLAGRAVEQRHALLTAFTDLIVDTLGVERSGVRGQIVEVAPENWGIAGVPASGARAAEIAARASAGEGALGSPTTTAPPPRPLS